MMNTRQKLKITFITIIFISFFNYSYLKAQRNENHRPFQLSFITPISTNWLSSYNTVNNFSLNMLWGTSAGVNGAEFGGLLNQTNGEVFGAQFGGLGNIVTGDLLGAQFGGLLNIGGHFKGIQAGGLLNISHSNSEMESSYSNGAQFAGLVNIQRSNMNGIQAAGLVNVLSGSIKGVQVAGLVNVADSSVQGVQIAGILNKAKNVSGVQIALINIADTISNGTVIGLLNLVKDGYSVLELETNESFYANIRYKIGTKDFYTIFSAAFEQQNGKPYWAPGFGFGTNRSISHRFGVNIDATAHQVNEDEWWTDRLNLINRLQLNVAFLLSNHFSIYGGPSINVKVSTIRDDEGNLIDSDFDVPKSFYERTGKRTSTIIYPGFNIGLRF